MKFNFLSASGSGLFSFFKWLPKNVAFSEEGPNSRMYKELMFRRKGPIGVSIMDFPGNPLIEEMIRTNDLEE